MMRWPFLGSNQFWCHDSQVLIPKAAKYLSQPMKNNIHKEHNHLNKFRQATALEPLPSCSHIIEKHVAAQKSVPYHPKVPAWRYGGTCTTFNNFSECPFQELAVTFGNIPTQGWP